MKRRVFVLAAASSLAATHVGVLAQLGDAKEPVTLLIPFLPGGSTDMVARMLSAKLQEKIRRAVVVQHSTGAGGDFAAAQLKRSKPDGGMLMVASAGMLAIALHLNKSAAYDPLKDFDYITVAVRMPNLLVVAASSPVKSAQALVAMMKKHPGMVSFGSSGRGSSDHLAAELFWQQTATRGLHVPGHGGVASTEELLGSGTHAAFQNINVVLDLVHSGKLRALAVTGDKRSSLLPDVPTTDQCGIPGVVVYSWQAVVAPRGLPDAVKKSLQAAFAAALDDTGVKSQLMAQGFEIVASTPDEASRFEALEYKRWGNLIKSRGIR